jgi:hypothetical protein
MSETNPKRGPEASKADVAPEPKTQPAPKPVEAESKADDTPSPTQAEADAIRLGAARGGAAPANASREVKAGSGPQYETR